MNASSDAAEQIVRISLNGMEAVSYTHLDVYKRQDEREPDVNDDSDMEEPEEDVIKEREYER